MFQISFDGKTGTLCEAGAGGYWGAALKRSGYDALIIEGASAGPVYLWIHNKKVEFRSASHLWGQDALKVQETIRREIGDERIRIVCIGEEPPLGGSSVKRKAAATPSLSSISVSKLPEPP